MGANPIEPFVQSILGLMTGVGITVGTIFLVWGAYQYMAASGNPRQMERGKASMLGALAGLAIVLGANTVIGIVQTALGGH